MADNLTELAWLADATPVETEFVKASKGRARTPNPFQGHAQRSYDSGKAIALEVPAGKATAAEKLARKAGTDNGWSVSVQVLSRNPEEGNLNADDVIALRGLADLPEDKPVWVSIKVGEKVQRAPRTKTETASTDENVDPFAGQPTAPEATESKTEDEAPAESKTNRRGGRKVPA